MENHFKSIVIGILMGIAPLVICTLFYFITQLAVKTNPVSILSYTIMGLYAMSSLAVFITSVIFIVHERPMTGAIALFIQIAQLIIAVGFLSGV